MNIKLGLLGLFGLMTACEAFKGGGSTIDTAAIGPTAVEPGDEPASEPSEPGDEPSSEPSDETDTEDTVDPNELDCKADPQYAGTLSDMPCVSGYIWEGETIDGSTTGEINYFTKSHYETSGWYCLPPQSFDGEYDSPERSFIFLHPGTGNCYAELETRCGDFDLIGLRHDVENDGCPVPGYPLSGANPCDMSATRGLGRVEELLMYETNQVPYLLIVDAPDPTDEWFRLTITCD